jgi:hypothetical protein
MPNRIETLALHLVRAVYNATNGQQMQWRSLEGLDLPESADAVRYAVTGGWILVQGEHSVCLTGVGRRIVDSHNQILSPADAVGAGSRGPR